MSGEAPKSEEQLGLRVRVSVFAENKGLKADVCEAP